MPRPRPRKPPVTIATRSVMAHLFRRRGLGGVSVRKCGITSLAKRRRFCRDVPPPFSSRYSTPCACSSSILRQISSGVPYRALSSLASRVSENAMMLAVLLPSGRWLIACRRRCAVIRRSTAAAFSSAVSATKKARATPTWDGSKPKPLRQHRRLVGVEPVDRLADRGELVQQQVMPAGGDLADTLGMAGALPERRMRLLVGRWLDDDVVELPVLAVERKPFVRGPGFGDDVDRFFEAGAGILHRNAEAGEFVVAIAFANAEIEAPAGQQVDRRGLFGQQHRIVPGQHQHRGPQPQGRWSWRRSSSAGSASPRPGQSR